VSWVRCACFIILLSAGDGKGVGQTSGVADL
jgi:hypothetical protein